MFTPRLLIVGPHRHGVTQYAMELGDAIAKLAGTALVRPTLSAADAEAEAAVHGMPAHIHVTDRIFGNSPEESAARIERMARHCRLTVTLHDLPQPSDGEVSLERRSNAYRRIAHAAAAVAVSSAHEATLFKNFVDGSPNMVPIVVPLGTRGRHTHSHDDLVPTSEPTRGVVVLIAGFLYPGKGHEDAIRAAAEVRGRQHSAAGASASQVRALGAVSDGHAAERKRLDDIAQKLDVELVVTGYLSEDDYYAERIGPGIPLAAHQHISASRTMLDWIDAGRSPLVVTSDYAREMQILRPGTLTLYEPDRLPEAIEAAWQDPSSTVLPATAEEPWTLDDAARAYLLWWNEAVNW